MKEQVMNVIEIFGRKLTMSISWTAITSVVMMTLSTPELMPLLRKLLNG